MKNILLKISGIFIGSLIFSQILALAFVSVESVFASVVPLQATFSSSQNPQSIAPDDGSGTTSYNWSGYVASGGIYTGVTGNWTVAKAVNPGTRLGSDASWIGIGGISSRDLVQAGTLSMTDNEGNSEYEAWIETLPDAPIDVPLTINAGDSISASITQASPGVWNIVMKDATTGQNYQTTVEYNSSLSSAEWIEEMPSNAVNNSFIPLNNFGSVPFTNSTTIKNGSSMTAAAAGAMPLTMQNGNDEALAVPSALSGDGSSFTVARTNASSVIAQNPQIIDVGGTGSGQSDVQPGSYIIITLTPQGFVIERQGTQQSTSEQPVQTVWQNVRRFHRRYSF